MSVVLVIDDNDAVRTALSVLFSLHGLETVTAESPEAGLAALDKHAVDLVVQDMNFTRDTTSGEEGIALFQALRERDPDLPVILLTAWTHLETAVSLVRAGAADYLGKPWEDEKLITTVTNLLELRAVSAEHRQLLAARRAARERLAERQQLCGLVYESDVMHELITVATRIAPANVPVLITGANGAGKEKVAEIVQANSSVREGPFIKVNVGALPAELIESELFGAEEGAYTGSSQARAGRFEAADGGTLFLDEIGNLSLPGQAKLLRVLQTGEFERLGSAKTRHVDVRVISATNADLSQAITDGEFREDLYYRLNVIELEVPPLAERMDDVLPLAEHFLEGRARVTASAREAMLRYQWPGNVRELRNRLQRAQLLCQEGHISPADLGLAGETDGRSVSSTMAGSPGALTADTVTEALARHDGNVTHAARDLGMSRQALYRRMEKFGLPRTR
ncbi:MAG: sigma-54 dependent transcriptional regulator [Pseudomonadota bacterium]